MPSPFSGDRELGAASRRRSTVLPPFGEPADHRERIHGAPRGPCKKINRSRLDPLAIPSQPRSCFLRSIRYARVPTGWAYRGLPSCLERGRAASAHQLKRSAHRSRARPAPDFVITEIADRLGRGGPGEYTFPRSAHSGEPMARERVASPKRVFLSRPAASTRFASDRARDDHALRRGDQTTTWTRSAISIPSIAAGTSKNRV